jgi:hypothetical protein
MVVHSYACLTPSLRTTTTTITITTPRRVRVRTTGVRARTNSLAIGSVSPSNEQAGSMAFSVEIY